VPIRPLKIFGAKILYGYHKMQILMPSLDPLKKMPTNLPFANSNKSKKLKFSVTFLLIIYFAIFLQLKKNSKLALNSVFFIPILNF
jgi:hypothetical protein